MFFYEYKLTNIANFLISSTITCCYCISYWKNVIPLWLPMISDCFVTTPANYISRVGVPLTAFILMVHNKILHEYIKSNYFVIAMVSSFALSVVAAVNEKENIYIHNYAAYCFFVTYLMNMCIVSYYIKSKRLITLMYSMFVLYAPFGNYLPQCEWCAVACIIWFIESTNREIGNIRIIDLLNY